VADDRALNDAARPPIIGGLGVDIVEIDRMALALTRTPRVKERLFSDDERAYCDARSRPEVHYALRFAAKEAVLKALGTGFSGVRFRDVEVARDERGRPIPLLHGRAAQLAEEAGVRELHLSLSYTATTAVASAVAISGAPPARPVEPEPTPQERVALMFKASRTLLDDIDSGPDAEPGEPASPAGIDDASVDAHDDAANGDSRAPAPCDGESSTT
jgi:holo-[acyl-carrier protein] synthase